MNTEAIKALGLDPTALQEMIVSRAVEQLLQEEGFDEDGELTERPSDLSSRISRHVKDRIDAKVNELAENHLLPKIDAHIDSLVLQQTNQWGEAKGAPMTVTEYLVARAEAYIVEPVDLNGKSRSEDVYNWRSHSTRIAHAINKHLQFEIDRAMQQALKEANTTMAKGLHEACRAAINEAAQKFAIVVKGA